jgi:hypothetical protein
VAPAVSSAAAASPGHKGHVGEVAGTSNRHGIAASVTALPMLNTRRARRSDGGVLAEVNVAGGVRTRTDALPRTARAVGQPRVRLTAKRATPRKPFATSRKHCNWTPTSRPRCRRSPSSGTRPDLASSRRRSSEEASKGKYRRIPSISTSVRFDRAGTVQREFGEERPETRSAPDSVACDPRRSGRIPWLAAGESAIVRSVLPFALQSRVALAIDD